MAKQDRRGQRKGREAFKKRIPDLGYYFIITDTKETEKNYVTGIRDSLPKELQGRLVIKVIESRTKDLVEKSKAQAAIQPQYAEPWIIFDRDEVAEFDEIIYSAENSGINIGWSNPCIEIWFDAYFGKMHQYDNSVKCCHEFARNFEKVTGNKYKKSQKHIYETLNKFGNEDLAIKVAEECLQGHIRNGKTKPSEMYPGTSLHKFVKEINSKVLVGGNSK